MIQAIELKVGNWVQRNDLDGVFTIRSVCVDRVHPINLTDHDYRKNVHYACECTLSELEPIPLVEDILLMAGFTFDGEYYSHPALTEKFLIYEGEKADEYRVHFTHRKYVSIYYVHQLQNIFFDLTGTALTIQLTK